MLDVYVRVELAEFQGKEVGDWTTSVVIVAAELLKEIGAYNRAVKLFPEILDITK